jgi:Fe-S cluster biogenesis protein NfuA/nitrite reductase/ring-hydroxylating ferredoxin subunit
LEDAQARERVDRVETLLEELEALPDPAAREKTTEVVQALLDLYGEGLGRIVAAVAERDSGDLAEALAADELVSHLLLLHDLHPVPLEQRVQGALDEVRPYLESHGGNVELLAVEGGVARLRLEGSCSGCPSSAMTLKLAIERAIHKAAPDIEAIDAHGAVAESPPPRLIQLEIAEPLGPTGGDPPRVEEEWATAGALPELSSGGSVVKLVAGEEVLFLRLNGTFYAYRPACPDCGGSLDEAPVSGDELACPGCGHRYDIRHAGACLDAPALHLDPLPLLVDEAGLVRVAVGSGFA